MSELTRDDVLCIRSYLNDGYSISEIEEVSGYTRDEIMDVKNIMRSQVKSTHKKCIVKGPDGFSDKVIKVICVILEKGVTDDEAYDTMLLYTTPYSRKRFHTLCNKLRNGIYYEHITKEFNIPKEPTSTYVSPFLNTTNYDPDKVKKFCTEESIEERKEAKRRKEELDKRRTEEAIARHERELKERANKKKILSPKTPTKVVQPVNIPAVVKETTAEDVLPKFDSLPSTVSIRNKIRDTCIMLSKNIPVNLISSQTGIDAKTIEDIKCGKAYTDISKKYGIVPQSLRGDLMNILKDIE